MRGGHRGSSPQSAGNKRTAKLSRYHRSQRKTRVLAVSLTAGRSDVESECIRTRCASACSPFVGVHQQMCGQLVMPGEIPGERTCRVAGVWREVFRAVFSGRLFMLATFPCLFFWVFLTDLVKRSGGSDGLNSSPRARPGLLAAPGVWHAIRVKCAHITGN